MITQSLPWTSRSLLRIVCPRSASQTGRWAGLSLNRRSSLTSNGGLKRRTVPGFATGSGRKGQSASISAEHGRSISMPQLASSSEPRLSTDLSISRQSSRSPRSADVAAFGGCVGARAVGRDGSTADTSSRSMLRIAISMPQLASSSEPRLSTDLSISRQSSRSPRSLAGFGIADSADVAAFGGCVGARAVGRDGSTADTSSRRSHQRQQRLQNPQFRSSPRSA
jgi:hypothetical protein